MEYRPAGQVEYRPAGQMVEVLRSYAAESQSRKQTTYSLVRGRSLGVYRYQYTVRILKVHVLKP